MLILDAYWCFQVPKKPVRVSSIVLFSPGYLARVISPVFWLGPVSLILAVLSRHALIWRLKLVREALGKLFKREVNQVPIIEGDHLVGLLGYQDFIRWLKLQNQSLVN